MRTVVLTAKQRKLLILLDNDGPEPTNIFYQLELGAGEAESTFAIMGADDVALDMDTEVGYLTEDELNDGSKDDLDNSV